MTSESLNLTRRKFILAGSAAIATPFILNMAGLVPDAKGAEKKVTYIISSDCIGCHYCFNECPQSAISWGDDKYEIDQKKCIQCGTCASVCNISAAHAVSASEQK
jgi:ferredoxin